MAGFKDFLKGAASAAYGYAQNEMDKANESYEKGMEMSDKWLIEACINSSGMRQAGYVKAAEDRGLKYEVQQEFRRRRG